MSAENHPTSARLQDAGHRNLDNLAHMLAAAFHHDHGAIVQVSDSLALFFPGFHNFDIETFPGEKHRFE